MLPEKLVTWFLPAHVRRNKAHRDYFEMHSMASAGIAGILVMSIIPLLLYHFEMGLHLWTYYLNVATIIITLLSLKYFGYWRIPNFFCAAIAYYIIYTWLVDTGLIYSANISMVHIYLIAALLVDRKYGWYVIFTNLLFLAVVYYATISGPIAVPFSVTLGSPLYAVLMHGIITVFLGGFLAHGLLSQERSRKQIKTLQDQKISLLDEAVRKRTEQLNNMRQTIASDFHDHTGNILAAISRQAGMLELKLHDRPDVLPLIKSIITNSNELYASSKDFLWSLNHDSDNPITLFQYLVGYGQHFYNQFDISFSAQMTGRTQESKQLDPFAALNLIYIFKEAMNNVIKHSGADEVIMTMSYCADIVIYTLSDNGTWKEADPETTHYGLANMERRALQSGFQYKLIRDHTGTSIATGLPLSTYLIKNEAQ